MSSLSFLIQNIKIRGRAVKINENSNWQIGLCRYFVVTLWWTVQ